MNKRVQQVLVLEHKDDSTVYKELNENKLYQVVIISFLFKAGDGYTMFKRDHLVHK